jgi:long-chain acyl-CoA synthetase
LYPGTLAIARADQPAIVMARSGETVSYREFEARANRLAHLLRSFGLQRLDHFAVFMENHSRYVECGAAGSRSGLYYTNVNSNLTPGELTYIVNDSLSKVLITSKAKQDVALMALRECPGVTLCMIVDGPTVSERVRNLDETTAPFPSTPIPDESLGAAMLYSSGTTGEPKGVLRPIPLQLPDYISPYSHAFATGWRFREGMIYLLPAPLYHSAPWVGVSGSLRFGGTLIVMERFEEEHYLQLVEKHRVTHTQLVPTMFSRMLKLPEEVRRRYDLSSLVAAVHGAAPCPAPVKEAMIDWWGPIIHEYYAATEGLGLVMCNSAERLAHKGTVGKVMAGELHVLDDEMREVRTREIGKLWFRAATPFEYFNDPVKTAQATSADGAMRTVGDIGYVDEEGYVYLTDRAAFMIISGGVNIYPQECENLLITHPKVADAAVFGVPNEELGEEVKAVVQLMPGLEPAPETEAELIAFCRESLARHKCPRSIDFEAKLPRSPTGKLFKGFLRERYWKGRESRIL